MSGRTRGLLLSATAVVAVTAGTLAASTGAALAVTCPTVNPTTGAVTPAPTPGVDWAGCILGAAALQNADLAGANLSDTNLISANLSGADLDQANLSGANMTVDTAASADLAGANLTGATLGGDQTDVNLTGADLNSATVSGNLSGANLTDADFTNASVTGGTLTGVTWTGAIFTGTTMFGVQSGGLIGTPQNLPANWTVTGGYLFGPGAILPGLSFPGIDLASADLVQADLAGTDLDGADLGGADLDNANLGTVNLTTADLADATMTGATLTNAVLTGANVDGADFTDALASGVQSGQVTGTPAALPYQFTLADGYLLGPGAELSRAQLAGTDLSEVDLNGADLTSADLAGADLDGANLGGAQLDADLSGASLDGATLSQAVLGLGNFTDADFTDANLANASLKQATITGAVLAGTTLASAQTGPLYGVPASLPSGWTEVQISEPAGSPALYALLGPSAVVTGTFNFDNVDLSGDDFAGADFEYANFNDDNLSGVNLSDSELGQVDFTGTDLTGANLADADLQEAGFTDSDLDGADISGAQLGSTTWNDTICPDGTNSGGHVDGSCIDPLVTAPPEAAPAVTAGTAGVNGWYTSPVTVSWNWVDAGAINPADCTQTSTTSTQGSAVVLTASCTDEAGNVGTATYTVKIDTAAPVVTLTGIRTGAQYVLGSVPAAGCTTSDAVSGVATQAALTLTTSGSHGLGQFMATCAGAADNAGNKSAPVRATYTVVAGFGGFLIPHPGSRVSGSAKSIAVRFRLANAVGKRLTGTAAASLAAGHNIRVALQGGKIKPIVATCSWDARGSYFQCLLKLRSGTPGHGTRYSILAQEKAGHRFVLIPPVGRAANPETIRIG